jgi:hypothetical protein
MLCKCPYLSHPSLQNPPWKVPTMNSTHDQVISFCDNHYIVILWKTICGSLYITKAHYKSTWNYLEVHTILVFHLKQNHVNWHFWILATIISLFNLWHNFSCVHPFLSTSSLLLYSPSQIVVFDVFVLSQFGAYPLSYGLHS